MANNTEDASQPKVTLHDIVTGTPAGNAAVNKAMELSIQDQAAVTRKAKEMRDNTEDVEHKWRAYSPSGNADGVVCDHCNTWRSVEALIQQEANRQSAEWFQELKAYCAVTVDGRRVVHVDDINRYLAAIQAERKQLQGDSDEPSK